MTSSNSARPTSHHYSKVAILHIALALTVLVSISGCINNAPKTDRHFLRSSASETVRYFRYAIDAKYHEAAYQCLTSSCRDEVSLLAFETLIRFVDVPELGGVGLKTLLMDSAIAANQEPVPGFPADRWITLIWSTDDQFIEYSLRLTKDSSSNSPGLWSIDLLSTRGFDISGAP